MPDLDVQLRAYFDAAITQIDAAEAKGHVQVPGPPRRPSSPLRGWPAVAATVIAVLVAVGGVLALTRLLTGSPVTPVQPPATWKVGTPVPTGDAPSGLGTAGGNLVVVDGTSHTAVRVDAHGEVTPLADGPDGPRHPPSAFGSLWLVSSRNLVRIDPDTGTLQALLPVSGDNLAVAATDTAVWVAGQGADDRRWLWRIDPATNTVDSLPQTSGGQVATLTFDGTSLWVAANCGPNPCSDADQPRLATIDPDTGTVTPVDVLPADLYVNDAVVIEGRLWLAGVIDFGSPNPRGLLVSVGADGRIDRQVYLGRVPVGMALGPNGLWVTDFLDASLTLVDPHTGATIAGPIQVGTAYPHDGTFDLRRDYSYPTAVAVAGDTVWVADTRDGTVVPVTAITATTSAGRSTDPPTIPGLAAESEVPLVEVPPDPSDASFEWSHAYRAGDLPPVNVGHPTAEFLAEAHRESTDPNTLVCLGSGGSVGCSEEQAGLLAISGLSFGGSDVRAWAWDFVPAQAVAVRFTDQNGTTTWQRPADRLVIFPANGTCGCRMDAIDANGDVITSADVGP